MNTRPTTTVNEYVWREFLREVAKAKGIGKGVIKESLEEALQGWVENGRKERENWSSG